MSKKKVTSTDAVREHARRVLEKHNRNNEARLERIAKLEAEGHRIVNGGQTSHTGWEITDWRTGEVIAEGEYGIEGYNAATERLDPDGKWYHFDHTFDDETLEPTKTPGVPPSLARAIEENWIDALDTPDEEIAEFISWPVAKVRKYREDL